MCPVELLLQTWCCFRVWSKHRLIMRSALWLLVFVTFFYFSKNLTLITKNIKSYFSIPFLKKCLEILQTCSILAFGSFQPSHSSLSSPAVLSRFTDNNRRCSPYVQVLPQLPDKTRSAPSQSPPSPCSWSCQRHGPEDSAPPSTWPSRRWLPPPGRTSAASPGAPSVRNKLK